MNTINNTTDYWFKIEPYVFASITEKRILLYNIFDGVIIESENNEVICLLQELLHEKNHGVLLLKNERYRQKDIYVFIEELREKFMGDVLEISFSKGKPIQMLPFFNYPDKRDAYRRLNSASYKNVLENLFEITIHVNTTMNLVKLISFLQSIPENLVLNINFDRTIKDFSRFKELLCLLDRRHTDKYLFCSYVNVMPLQPDFNNKFSYKISVDFPLDIQSWNNSRQVLLNQTLLFEYIFNVLSEDDYLQAEQLINQFEIEKYQIRPLYSGDNIAFFEDYVFLYQEDILSTRVTIKDFFARQAINMNDFGKINIMPNGDVFANTNHKILGNIFSHSIHEIVNREMEEGESWFRIRNNAPCNTCVYQWLCPSPSDYELKIGRSNLCHVNTEVKEK